MEFVPLLVAGAMVWSSVAFLKLLRARLYHDAATFLVVVAVGIGVAFLLRASDFAAGIDVGAVALGDLNVASTVLFGYAISSTARATYEVKKAVDSGDEAKEPKLFVPAGTPAGTVDG